MLTSACSSTARYSRAQTEQVFSSPPRPARQLAGNRRRLRTELKLVTGPDCSVRVFTFRTVSVTRFCHTVFSVASPVAVRQVWLTSSLSRMPASWEMEAGGSRRELTRLVKVSR